MLFITNQKVPMKDFFKQIFLLFPLLFVLGFLSCDNEDEPEEGAGNCDRVINIDSNGYINGLSDDYTLVDVELMDKCLHITFSASGCDGELWDIALVDADQIAESLPVQRFAKLTLQNEEDCQTVITKELSFNMEILEAEGESSFILNLDDWPMPIIYEY